MKHNNEQSAGYIIEHANIIAWFSDCTDNNVKEINYIIV